MTMAPGVLEALQSLALGFAAAGLLASTFELFTSKRASFHLLELGGFRAVASVPVVVFSAPFIIMRNTILGRQIEHRSMIAVMIATVIACFWSMMSGRLVLDVALRIAG